MSADLSRSDSGGSRLKPPPVVINKNKSVVKLNQSKSSLPKAEVKSPDVPTSGVRKLKINTSSAVSGAKPTTLKLKRTSSGGSKPSENSKDISKTKSEESVPPSKKVTLKRPVSEEEVSLNFGDESQNERIKKNKKKTCLCEFGTNTVVVHI